MVLSSYVPVDLHPIESLLEQVTLHFLLSFSSFACSILIWL